MSLFQSTDSLHQKLNDILAQFSKVGISVVEFRDYSYFVDIVVDKPVNQETFKKLYSDLLDNYDIMVFQIKHGLPLLRLVPFKQRPSMLHRYRWILSGITIITVFMTGLGLSQGLHSTLSKIYENTIRLEGVLLDAIIYTAIFLVTLLSHELGHLITSKKSNIKAEGPILIPAPPIQLGFIGTLGAVILTKTPPASRKDLAKMGLAGPVAGFIVATTFGILGVHLSPVINYDIAIKLIQTGEISPVGIGSIGLYLLLHLRREEGVMLIHPVLFVSYVIYLVTFLNLLPIGQLDGGHVIRSLTSNKTYRFISSIIPPTLLATGLILVWMGLEGSYMFSFGLLSLILYFVMGRKGHPGVANQYDESKCLLCLVVYIVLVILTAPIPLI